MYQVKMFDTGNGQNIEVMANNWLGEQGEKIEIVAITHGANEFRHVFTILYKPKIAEKTTTCKCGAIWPFDRFKRQKLSDCPHCNSLQWPKAKPIGFVDKPLKRK